LAKEETFDFTRSVEAHSSSFLVSLEIEVGMYSEGSNIITGPQDALTKLVNVKSDCSNFDQLPHNASMAFPPPMKIGGVDLSVPPSGYVMKVPMPSWTNTAGGDTKAMHGDSSDAEEAENPIHRP
jgi:hypothetical protein